MAPTLRPLVPHPPSQSSRPERASRKRVTSYREYSSDTDNFAVSVDDEAASYHPSPSRSSPRKRTRRLLTLPDDSPTQSQPPSRSSITAPVPKITRASSLYEKRSLFRNTSAKSKKIASPGKNNTRPQQHTPMANPPANVGTIPPWQTLPYHVLFDIFMRVFSSSSPQDELEVLRSVKWLLRMARLCRAFHDPAIAALFYSPPLYPPVRFRDLENLLSRPQETLSTNYQNKVKRLDIDIQSHPLRHYDIHRLVALTPRLKHLQLYIGEEHISSGLLPNFVPWDIWVDLLNALDEAGCHLHSWQWNGDFLGTERDFPLSLLTEAHTRPCLVDLKTLRIENMFKWICLSTKEDEAKALGPTLASSLTALPYLRSLEVRKSWIVDDGFLLNLPTSLTCLSLVNCDQVDSALLETYLASHGQHLRRLSLDQNRHLNMSFTKDLAKACPHLEVFKIGFTCTPIDFYHHHTAPKFDRLLEDSEVPSWPPTLRYLELDRIQKCNLGMAQALFSSLIDSAPNLPALRTLILTAAINIPWRDRATFRKQRVRKLEKVFQRMSAPPNPNWDSLSKVGSEGNELSGGQSDATNGHADDSGTEIIRIRRPKRQSVRLAEQKLSEMSNDDDGEDGMFSDLAAHASASADEGLWSKKDFIQGMCDVVEIRIDNLRPMDHMFTADDFRDEEVSGDEDWSEQDVDVDVEDEHAW
ncbi:hypothetical protein AJ80_04719 [Polytolypa hystricis UAMH7299]|uniref:F-box domain-containing protein n=1 Tax=Polytolypa hystricis (strain UAMH7299) TaxID=1447883 RepID=A0A2B7Y9H1_POLH7|nr:hypothetical protein AJ80_04719 [Polytolypa hystricis UAMH7299]